MTVRNAENNMAFIDAQNLRKTLLSRGINLDYYKFREYLRKRLNVNRVVVFLGWLQNCREDYKYYHRAGFEIVFKEAIPYKDAHGRQRMKANVDIDMAVGVLGEYINDYDKAIVVTGDGDFMPLVKFLRKKDRLKALIIPNANSYSQVYNQLELKPYRIFMSDLETR
ncbi:NYN domain-containing protein, partial [Candidatus Saccharibacteria bacterium]|nr:NYN domain-containing protein [Candidatus Saccharibacteria bacterium]